MICIIFKSTVHILNPFIDFVDFFLILFLVNPCYAKIKYKRPDLLLDRRREICLKVLFKSEDSDYFVCKRSFVSSFEVGRSYDIDVAFAFLPPQFFELRNQLLRLTGDVYRKNVLPPYGRTVAFVP